MLVLYIKLYLLLIIYFLGENSVHCFSSSSLSHCNYTIDRIDAITNFTNGSLFVASGQNYWILSPNEKPIHGNSRKINEFLPELKRVEAAVNIKIKGDAQLGKCISLSEQIVFYSQVYIFFDKLCLLLTLVYQLINDYLIAVFAITMSS